MSEPTFEEALSQLEAVVGRLEASDLPLEASLRRRNRTCKISWRRADISAFNSAAGSCFQCVRVVKMIGPGW